MKRVGVVGNPEYEDVPRLLRRLTNQAESLGLDLYLDRGLTTYVEDDAAQVLPEQPSELDVLMTLGGDGTLLRGARWAGPAGVPVLGVNLGRLGFLTSVAPDDLDEALARVATDDFVLDARMALAVQTVQGEGEPASYFALNDAVLHKSGFARVVYLKVWVNEEEVGLYSADGVIVSTPTGSTAYSLSAGGPILDPRLDAIVTTPICPHTLAVRPLVLPPDALVEVEVCAPSEEIILTIDGQVGSALKPGDRILARRADLPARLVRWHDQSFFALLRRKLKWGDLSGRIGSENS